MQSDSRMSKKSNECSICGKLTAGAKDTALVANSEHSSVISSGTEDLKKANTITRNIKCKACRELEFKKYELKKQQHKIERKLLVHKTLNHDVDSDVGEKEIPKEAKDDEKVKEQTGSVKEVEPNSHSSLLNRLPFLAKTRSMSQPPQPRIKRLKGDVAKFVGRRNDGSDWQMIQPGHPNIKGFPEASHTLHQP